MGGGGLTRWRRLTESGLRPIEVATFPKDNSFFCFFSFWPGCWERARFGGRWGVGRFAMESHGKCPKIRPQTPKTPRKNGWFAMESHGKCPKIRSGPSWEPLGRLLGAFWAVLGAFGTVLRTSRAVLGASWAVLGVSWAVLEHTGPSWGRQEAPSGLQDTSRRHMFIYSQGFRPEMRSKMGSKNGLQNGG